MEPWVIKLGLGIVAATCLVWAVPLYRTYQYRKEFKALKRIHDQSLELIDVDDRDKYGEGGCP